MSARCCVLRSNPLAECGGSGVDPVMSTSTNAWLLAQKPAACTHATTNPTDLIQQAVSMLSRREARLHRDVTRRSRAYAHLCSPGRCTFLSNTPRMVLGDLLQDLGYRGWSAEVGVWRGDNSKTLMSRWASGGRHYLVDPYLSYGDGCNVTGQWHCVHTQRKFDALYEETKQYLYRVSPTRPVFLRNYSVQATATMGSTQLDYIYLDGRHDMQGVLEDLKVWVPRLCKGGILAGHDYSNAGDGVARALQIFMSSDEGRVLLGEPSRIFVTSDHPASFFLFRGVGSHIALPPGLPHALST